MICIENRFCIIAGDSVFSLLLDEVTSCITDDKIFGTVATALSIDEALALGNALVRAAEEAKARTKSPSRIAIDAALAAARAQAARKEAGNG
ncbi:MAG: hypothetical protein ACXW2U_05330 [Telluria sp.]